MNVGIKSELYLDVVIVAGEYQITGRTVADEKDLLTSSSSASHAFVEASAAATDSGLIDVARAADELNIVILKGRLQTLVSTIAFVIATLFTLLPARADVDLTNDCAPNGVFASIYAKIFPEQFWKGQLEEVDKALDKQRGMPEEIAEFGKKVDKILAETDARMENYYREHPDRRSPPPTPSEKLRELADKLEEAEMDAWLEQRRQQRIKVLEKCRRQIARKLFK